MCFTKKFFGELQFKDFKNFPRYVYPQNVKITNILTGIRSTGALLSIEKSKYVYPMEIVGYSGGGAISDNPYGDSRVFWWGRY